MNEALMKEYEKTFMDKVAVIHAAFDEKPHTVAFVLVDKTLSDEEKCEEAFMKTNTINTQTNHKYYKIIFLGYHQNAASLFEYVNKEGNYELPETVVIDYRYAIQDQIKSFGADVFYGDISNPHTLEAAGVANADVVVRIIHIAEQTAVKKAHSIRKLNGKVVQSLHMIPVSYTHLRAHET